MLMDNIKMHLETIKNSGRDHLIPILVLDLLLLRNVIGDRIKNMRWGWEDQQLSPPMPLTTLINIHCFRVFQIVQIEKNKNENHYHLIHF